MYLFSYFKNEELLHCDYKNQNTKSDFINIYCKLKIKCLDHPSFKSDGQIFNLFENPEKMATQTKDIIYISDETLDIYIQEIKLISIRLINDFYREDFSDYDNENGIHPHVHGGYIVESKFDKTPICIIDKNCDFSYFYFGIHVYLPKANCQLDTDNSGEMICSFISPIIEDLTILEYYIYLSFDFGVTFINKLNTKKIQLSGLCKQGYYCKNFYQKIVPRGHFCEIIPTEAHHIYCKYPRKCMPGK